MTLYGESILIINTILCFLTSIFSYLIYKKNKNLTIFNISIAFLLFGISHIISFLELQETLYLPLLIIRLTAYFTIISTVINNKKQRPFKLVALFSIITSFILFFIPQILDFLSITLSTNSLLHIVDLSLCILIASIFLFKYKKSKNIVLNIIGIGFLLFALSHTFQIIAVNIHIQTNFTTLFAILRMLSYTLIMLGIYFQIKNKTINEIIKYTTNTKLQISAIIIMIAILTLLFYYPTKRFLSSDPKPTINSIKPISKNNEIKKINTGLYIKNFTVFDIIKNQFIMNAIIWFELAPHQINLNVIDNFTFEKGKILKKSKIKSKIINDKLWVHYKIKVEFNSDLGYKFFPLEDHRIYITLSNTQMNPDSEILVSHNTNLTIKNNIFTGNWRKIGKEVEYGYIEQSFDKYQKEKSIKYPVVSYELYIEKDGIRKTLAIFLPLFMVFFLSMLSLLINIKNSNSILSLSVGSTSALIFNLIVIERMSPNVRYFTIANKVFSLLLVTSFAILLLNIYITKAIKNEKNEKKLILIRSYSFLFFIIFVLITIYSMLY